VAVLVVTLLPLLVVQVVPVVVQERGTPLQLTLEEVVRLVKDSREELQLVNQETIALARVVGLGLLVETLQRTVVLVVRV